MFLRTQIFDRVFRYTGTIGLAALILGTFGFGPGPVVLQSADPVLDGTSRVAEQLEVSRERFKTAKEWEARRASLREGFLRGAKLWPLPERSAPNAIIHSKRIYPEYSVENIAIETMPGFYCFGNLYRPTRFKGPHPAILLPQGHFEEGRFSAENQIVSGQLARMGAIVFTYSMVGREESTQTTHEDPNVLALQTWNSIRVVDYLSSLKIVDHTRIGVTGASGGGTQAMFLTLVDDRIAASAPVVIIYGWSWFSPACICENGMPVMNHPETNAIELAAVAAPRPQLIVTTRLYSTESGQLDGSHNFPTDGFPFVQNVYRSFGQPDNVKNVHLPEGHDFGPAKRKEVYAFFAQHLGLKLLEENPGKIRIASPKDLMVFTDKHPRPPTAFGGVERVTREFNKLAGSRLSDTN